MGKRVLLGGKAHSDERRSADRGRGGEPRSQKYDGEDLTNFADVKSRSSFFHNLDGRVRRPHVRGKIVKTSIDCTPSRATA